MLNLIKKNSSDQINLSKNHGKQNKTGEQQLFDTHPNSYHQ